MRSHEARPSSVPPKLELWGETQHCYPPVKTLKGTVPPCLSMFYATVRFSCLLSEYSLID